jgi:hypothetical protein
LLFGASGAKNGLGFANWGIILFQNMELMVGRRKLFLATITIRRGNNVGMDSWDDLFIQPEIETCLLPSFLT